MSASVKVIKQKSSPMFWLVNVLAFAFLLLIIGLASQPAHAIKKCKDADGKWHYGDVAVRACEDSKITTLSNKGFVRKVKAAPKTEEQIAAEEASRLQIEAQKQRKLEEEREKTRILSVYETEADIDRQRDNQLYSVDSNIAVHNTYLESLQDLIAHEQKKAATAKKPLFKDIAEKKIKEAEESYEVYSSEVVLLKSEREAIIEKFDKEKLVYRELTKQDDQSNESLEIKDPQEIK